MFLFSVCIGFDSFILFYFYFLGCKEEVQTFKIVSFCCVLQRVEERLSGNDDIIVSYSFNQQIYRRLAWTFFFVCLDFPFFSFICLFTTNLLEFNVEF
jgi:hypothetical protein